LLVKNEDYTPNNFITIAYCSGQNLTAPKDHDTCPAAPKAPQTDDEHYMPINA